MTRSIKKISCFIISILIPLSIGFLSSILTKNSFDYYQTLIKPFFSPPGWIFAPVWTILYILMGIASYRIAKSDNSTILIKNALFFYVLQLILNFLWPILFFRFNLTFIAFIEIIILLVFIIITTLKFYNLDKFSAYLMIPYILWVSFASLLNFSIWFLNK
nr:TspO/MBR family protein [Clostridiisalibacter paucivorans]